jgi:hypothetical protein
VQGIGSNVETNGMTTLGDMDAGHIFGSSVSAEALRTLDERTRKVLEKIIAVTCYYQKIETDFELTESEGSDYLPALGRIYDAIERRFTILKRSPTMPTPRQIIAKRRREERKEACQSAFTSMVDCMLLSGQLVLERQALNQNTFAKPKKGGPNKSQKYRIRLKLKPPAEGSSLADNARAYRDALVQRLLPDADPESKTYLSEVFRQVRQALRTVDTSERGGGKLILIGMPQTLWAVIMPSSVEFHRHGVRVTGADIVTSDHTGLKHYTITPECCHRLNIMFTPDGVVFTADLEGLKSQTDVSPLVKSVLPFTSVSRGYSPQKDGWIKLDWDALEQYCNLKLPSRARQGFHKALLLRYKGANQKDGLASSLLRGSLKEDVVRVACRCIPNVDGGAYNWLCADGGQKRERRMQAATAYPILFSVMVRDETITHAIDNGLELVSLLRKCTGMYKSTLSRVGHLCWQRVGKLLQDDLHMGRNGRSLLTSLNFCPVDRMPQKRVEWSHAYKKLTSIQSLAFTLRLSDDQKNAFLQTIIPRLAKDWMNTIEHNFSHIEDMVRDVGHRMASALHISILDRHTDDYRRCENATVAALIVGSHPSLGALKDLSDNWHTAHHTLRNRVQAAEEAARLRLSSEEDTKPPPPTTWPALDHDFNHAGGRMEWLKSQDKLADESDVMGHCVWSYYNTCLYGSSHIAAVHSAQGGRSTVEFRIMKTEKEALEGQESVVLLSLVNVQHRAYRNKEPSQDCLELVQAFLQSRSSNLDLEALEKAVDERRVLQPMMKHCNLYQDIQFCQDILTIYRPFLHKAVRHLSNNQLLELVANEVQQQPPAHQEWDMF